MKKLIRWFCKIIGIENSYLVTAIRIHAKRNQTRKNNAKYYSHNKTGDLKWKKKGLKIWH